MQFNSFIFILLLLPVSAIAYFLLNKINSMLGKLVLIASSIVFYIYSDWKAGIVLLASLILNYICALILKKSEKLHKLFLAIPVIINIALLVYFKYTNFAIASINTWFKLDVALQNLILPLGISFFTFQQIAYIVAVHKKELEKISVIDYLAYILYFPKILMGPLADPVDFINQLNNPELKRANWDNIACGLKIFSFGLFKKVMIADICANAVSWGFTNMKTATSLDWILVVLFYTFEIYFDFSGYSDMAVGVSLILNIQLPMNFDSPYKALSIRDFWKRWHMSLTKFFTKYVYIPLGGSRKGKVMTYVNTMIIFLISGLWHGSNWTFLLWGFLHGALMIFDRVFEKVEEKTFAPLRWIVTFFVSNILWLLFRSDSIEQWITIMKKIVHLKSTKVSGGLIEVFNLPETTFLQNIFHMNFLTDNIRGFWMIVYILGAFGICLIPENNYRNLKKLSVPSLIFAIIAFVWGFICLSGESVFVYFNF